jgi:hypothetical protein
MIAPKHPRQPSLIAEDPIISLAIFKASDLIEISA